MISLIKEHKTPVKTVFCEKFCEKYIFASIEVAIKP